MLAACSQKQENGDDSDANNQWCKTAMKEIRIKEPTNVDQMTTHFKPARKRKQEGKTTWNLFQGQQKVICLPEEIPHSVTLLTEESVAMLIGILSSPLSSVERGGDEI